MDHTNYSFYPAQPTGFTDYFSPQPAILAAPASIPVAVADPPATGTYFAHPHSYHVAKAPHHASIISMTPTKPINMRGNGIYAGTPSPGTDASSAPGSDQSARSFEYHQSPGGGLLPAGEIHDGYGYGHTGDIPVGLMGSTPPPASNDPDHHDLQRRLQISGSAYPQFNDYQFASVNAAHPTAGQVDHQAHQQQHYHSTEPLSPTQQRHPSLAPSLSPTKSWPGARSRTSSVSSHVGVPSPIDSPVRHSATKRVHEMSISPAENLPYGNILAKDKRFRHGVDEESFGPGSRYDAWRQRNGSTGSSTGSPAYSPAESPRHAHSAHFLGGGLGGGLAPGFGVGAFVAQPMTPSSSVEAELGPKMSRSRSGSTTLAGQASDARKATNARRSSVSGRRRSPSWAGFGSRRGEFSLAEEMMDSLPEGFSYVFTDEPKETNRWPELVEQAFYLALKLVPRIGRRKILISDGHNNNKSMGRNELISQYIHYFLGVHRDRKQVSSHVQVLKGKPNNDCQSFDFLVEFDKKDKDRDTDVPAWCHPEAIRIFEEIFPHSNLRSMVSDDGYLTVVTSSEGPRNDNLPSKTKPSPRPRLSPFEAAYYAPQTNWEEENWQKRQELEDDYESVKAAKTRDATIQLPMRRILYRTPPRDVMSEYHDLAEHIVAEMLEKDVERREQELRQAGVPSVHIQPAPFANFPAASNGPFSTNVSNFAAAAAAEETKSTKSSLLQRRRGKTCSAGSDGGPPAPLRIGLVPPCLPLAPLSGDPAPITPVGQVHGAPLAPPPIDTGRDALENQNRLLEYHRRYSKLDVGMDSPAIDGNFEQIAAAGDGEPSAAERLRMVTDQGLTTGADGRPAPVRKMSGRRATVSGTGLAMGSVRPPQLPNVPIQFQRQ